MPGSKRVTCAIIVGVCVTAAVPVLAAIALARQQAIEREEQFAADLSRTALVVAETTAAQLAVVARAVGRLDRDAACSQRGLDLMRKLDLGSTLLQGFGWIEGNTMRCSSFGGRQAFDLGPADFTSGRTSVFRTDVQLIDPDYPYVAVQTGSSVGIVHKDLALSFVEEVPGATVAVFAWSNRQPIISRGPMPPGLIDTKTGGDFVFRSAGRTVAIARSSGYDVGTIAILPAGYVADYAGETAKVLLPLGVLAGLALSALLIYVVRTRSSMPAMIRAALKGGDFRLVYQPVIELSSGRMIGAEALIRWDRGDSEPIPPDKFIPVAEQVGLIPLVTARVLELLAEDARPILRVAPHFHFGVNFAPADMHRTNVLEEVTRLVQSSGIAFSSLIVEATERSLVDVDRARETMRRLRAAGIRVAIDDFGTGYSSLAYLAQLEVDFLKIDRIFVQALGTDSATSQVAARIIDMAKDLRLTIIAEGIETQQQELLLKNLGVEYAQGYLYGRPVPLEDIMLRLRAERTRPRAPLEAA
jgi:sensor c-di-GMP phosphodiesterase-like protein